LSWRWGGHRAIVELGGLLPDVLCDRLPAQALFLPLAVQSLEESTDIEVARSDASCWA
jgi:hypothetical protein